MSGPRNTGGCRNPPLQEDAIRSYSLRDRPAPYLDLELVYGAPNLHGADNFILYFPTCTHYARPLVHTRRAMAHAPIIISLARHDTCYDTRFASLLGSKS
jgi:hypothetical protein